MVHYLPTFMFFSCIIFCAVIFVEAIAYFFDESVLYTLYEFLQEIFVEAGYCNNPKAIARVIKKYEEKISLYRLELKKDDKYNYLYLYKLRKLLFLEMIKLERMEYRLKRANRS